MSERRSAADLGMNAEALLAAFPCPERDWESDARAVEARLSEAGSSDELLLAAPLPSEPGEPSGISATATPLSHSGVRTQSLAELARRSVEKKQAGEREMARASLAMSSRAAAAAPPPPPPSVTSAVVASARPLPVVARSAERRPASARTWPKLALAVPVLALAAAALLWLKRPVEPAPLVANALPVATVAATPAAVATTLGTAQAPSAPQGVDPSTLPGEAPSKPAEAARTKAVAVAAGAPPTSAASARANSEKIVLEDEQPQVAPTAAAAADKPAEKALPPDPALRPADSSGGEIPVRPSTGAVQAALGAVMSSARHCVAGDDGASSAVVSFGSDGRVQNVAVSGPAAGKASGACIQAQLAKARVQPFAASNFSVNATIRPD